MIQSVYDQPKGLEGRTYSIRIFVEAGTVSFQADTQCHKKANEEPCKTNCGICIDRLVPVRSPEDNYGSMEGDGLCDTGVESDSER